MRSARAAILASPTSARPQRAASVERRKPLYTAAKAAASIETSGVPLALVAVNLPPPAAGPEHSMRQRPSFQGADGSVMWMVKDPSGAAVAGGRGGGGLSGRRPGAHTAA